MLTGSSLVTAVWAAVGVVIVFAAVIMIIFKFFLGAQKNIGGGIAALAGVAVMAALAASPDTVIAAGNVMKGIVGL